MYKNILFAIEFSEAANTTGKRIKKLASTLKANLFLIHALELPVLNSFPEIPNKEGLYMQEAKRHMAGIAKNLDVPESHQIIEVGNPRIIIPEFIKKYHIDLLVVGHHEKKRLDRILGSTSYALLAHATYEVLVIPFQNITNRFMRIIYRNNFMHRHRMNAGLAILRISRRWKAGFIWLLLWTYFQEKS